MRITTFALGLAFALLLAGCISNSTDEQSNRVEETDERHDRYIVLSPIEAPSKFIEIQPHDAEIEALRPMVELLESANGNSAHRVVSLETVDAISRELDRRWQDAHDEARPYGSPIAYDGMYYSYAVAVTRS